MTHTDSSDIIPSCVPSVIRTIAAVFLLLSHAVSPASAQTNAAPMPAPLLVPTQEPISALFRVGVDGVNIPVYEARVCNLTPDQRKHLAVRPLKEQTSLAAFASFDVKDNVSVTVTVTVTYPDAVKSVRILPSSVGIKPVISGNSISFSVSRPGSFTVEVNGDWIQSLHLFANPPETDIPSATDPNVVYFGPGIHAVEHLDVHSGQTVYLSPGAVVYGKPSDDHPRAAIVSLVGDSITLRGRGIIDGSLCPHGTRSIVYAQGKNIRVEGVILRDSGGFTLPVRRCDNIKVNNVKVLGWRGNSDGMDICNSRHVEVSDCFLRTFDDLVVIKTDKNQGEARDIDVHHCVLWNEFAHALSLGAELREPVTDVRFHDCDVIRDKGREWVLRVYNCDAAPISNVVWDNILIEEGRRLMSVWIGKAIWSRDTERGHICDITFRNITSVAPDVPGCIADLTGIDTDHAIDGVRFEKVRVDGKPLTIPDVKQNAFVRDIQISP